MLASELMSSIAGHMAQYGDMQVFSGDMSPPKIYVSEAEEPETYGPKYVFIEIP